MGQGQPREIIWTILVVLTYTMLHTKFQGHRSIGSGEEDFLRFLPYMGMAAILVMWPEPFEQLFVPPIPGGYIWNLVTIGLVVSEEKSFEIVDGRRRTTTDDGACLYYKLPRGLRLRWAKNKDMWQHHWLPPFGAQFYIKDQMWLKLNRNSKIACDQFWDMWDICHSLLSKPWGLYW